jgi:RNA polymerase sigma factor (sigma-70 family)
VVDAGSTDQQLIARFRAGDDAAFAQIFDRHRPALVRYAEKILKSSPGNAEDVVQEAMLRTSLALRRDERHIELKPWLYRVTRNSALDELSRLRTDSVALDDEEVHLELRAAPSTEPEVAAEGRSKIRGVLSDIAHLPETQRHALIRREIDGISHADLANELGTTTQATKNLVLRARTNLVKAEEARSTDCVPVRNDLLEAHDEGRRASASTYRHLASCKQCRHFRAGLKDTRKAAAILLPGPLVLIALGVLTGKAAASTAAKGAAVKAGATAGAGAVATVGALGVGITTFGPGDPAPVSVSSPALVQRVEAGGDVPRGTAIVRASVPIAKGTERHPVVTIPCPPGLRVADLLETRGVPLSAEYAGGTVVGTSSEAKIRFTGRALERDGKATVSILCKVPDASGSVVAQEPGTARAAGGRETVRVAVPHAYLHDSPDGPVRGSVRLGQPLTVVGEPRDGFQRVVTDQDVRGWVPVSALQR